MNRWLVILVLTASWSCSKPEACIEARDTYFQNLQVEMRSCGKADAIFWDFGDGRGATGTRVAHNFDTSGHKTVTLIALADNGRREAEDSKTIFVGYKQIDSVLVTRFSASYWPNVNPSRGPNMYLRIGRIRSDQTYDDFPVTRPVNENNPIRFTFQDTDSRILSAQSSYPFQIRDENYTASIPNIVIDSNLSTHPLRDIDENPQIFEGAFQRTSIRIYWSLTE